MNYILTSFLFLVTIAGVAQQSTSSPYSIYGLGEPTRSMNTTSASMAHAGIAYSDATVINAFNPASYTDFTRPAFSFDLKNEALSLSSGSTSQSSSSFSIQNFSFAFPIINDYKKHKRRMGLSFGLSPISSSGYELYDAETVAGLGKIEYRFFGDGGINSLHAGTGFDLLANKERTNLVSIGANAHYVFGQVSKNRVTEIEPSASSTNLYRTTNLEVSDIDFNIGLRAAHIDTITRVYWTKDSVREVKQTLALMTFGAFIRPNSNWSTYTQNLEYTFTDSFTRPNIVDTLVAESFSGTTRSPLSFGVGFSINLDNQWVVSLDYAQTQWSKLEVNGVNAGLNNSRRMALGFRYIPEFDKKGKGNYLRVVRYRAGFSFEQTMLNISGSQPIRYGVAMGLGFPLNSASSSNSIFNIGAELARRDTPGQSLSENYLNIHAGFTITPHRFDQWFAKRKYD